MNLALLLAALVVLIPLGIRLGGRGEAGTIAAVLLTTGVVVAGMSTLA